MNALNLEKQAIAQSNAGFYLGNYCATLLDHKTHLRAWSLIRRASSPPSPASRRRIKNSRVSCLEEGNSPLLMLGEGSGVRVARVLTVFQNMRIGTIFFWFNKYKISHQLEVQP